MDPLVEIPLNNFKYRFRRLSWTEEARITPAPGEDARDVLLALALHDVSGLLIASFDEARKVIARIPNTLRSRIWVVYRGSIPPERYYHTEGLYRAPEYQAFHKQLVGAGDTEEASPGEGGATPPDDLVQRFGLTEAREARELERTMLEQAVERRGKEAGR